MSSPIDYARRHVLAALDAAGEWMSEREVREASGLPVGPAREALWELCRDGRVVRRRTGAARSGPHPRVRYALNPDIAGTHPPNGQSLIQNGDVSAAHAA